MRRSVVCLAVFLLTSTGASAATISTPDRKYWTASPQIAPGRVVVKLSREAAREIADRRDDMLPRGVAWLDAMVAKHSISRGRRAILERGTPVGDPTLFEKIGLDRVWVFETTATASVSDTLAVVRDFAGKPEVEWAEPVYVALPTAVPNDTFFPQQWTHRNVGQSVNGTAGTPDADADTDLAWDTVIGNPSAIVAVLDSGADLDHPDLAANLLPGWDFIDDDPVPEDTSGHGTAVAGIAAARGNNGVGVAGVCWTCRVMPLRIGSSVDDADAIRFATDNGASTINMSHTFGAAWIQIILDATAYATVRGVLPFASATNVNGYNVGTPACYPEVVSVGGSNQNDVRIYAYNDLTELTGPAPNAMTTSLNGNYALFSGTSSSSPFAAAVGALLRVHDPDLHVRELRHVLRLGCEDEVGAPAEDTPGWDRYMGWGRINVDLALDRVAGPWLSLDRPHYMCAGELTVALKDTSAGANVAVTLTGSAGGDAETVLVTEVAGADGYYEGSIPISWAGVDGPIVTGDGKLDITHAETISAVAGALATTAFADCIKKVCQWPDLGLAVEGDADGDRSLDPGELWRIRPAVVNLQTEPLQDVRARLSTANPHVAILEPEAVWGDITPFTGGLPAAQQAFRVQLEAGAPAAGTVSFQLDTSGRGWTGDAQACAVESSLPSTIILMSNRDLGASTTTWNFDDGTAMGFVSEIAHGAAQPSGDLSECSGHWVDRWGALPVTGRAHSGAHAMRVGDGTAYGASVDAGLKTPLFTVPASGGAIGFRLWIDSELVGDTEAWDGIVVEAKRPAEPKWTYLADASYGDKQAVEACGADGMRVPFGATEKVMMIAGDGTGTASDHDTYDAVHHTSLSRFAGQQVQVRFRFGSHDGASAATHGTGAWLDTVQIHTGYVADTWPGAAPTGLAGSQANCPGSFDLAWNAVSGASGYEVYRSEVSCADAASTLVPLASTASPSFADDTIGDGVNYHWAVAAIESGTGSPTVRACITGGCPCAPPPDPTELRVGRAGADVLLSWLGSADVGPTWNVYRDSDPDPATWGPPLASGVTDEDGGTAGIQYRDAGGIPAGTIQHYLVTEVTCAESPLIP